MPIQIIVGTQWGDEGKGRIVDWYAAKSDFVARYNGGDNAGHSVTVGNTLFKLHLIPSGIIHPHAVAVLGNGMVINPQSLLAEMEMLKGHGILVGPQRLRISHAAHLITPSHQALDKALDAARGKGNIGTTGRGIGPAYTDKAIRRGLRFSDMMESSFLNKLNTLTREINNQLSSLGADEMDVAKIEQDFIQYRSILLPYITDVSILLSDAHEKKAFILAEGAQGTLLDIDHGTYPYVTSSSTTAPGVFSGLGLGLTTANGAIVTGVCKSFQTRVGSGPFPTEVIGEIAERLRGSGKNPWDEFGTTTGRARRVGWLDGVLLRYAVRINGLTELIITKMDILSGLKELKICVGYRKNGVEIRDIVFGPSNLEDYEPMYETMPGWDEDICGVREWDRLPHQARSYIAAISKLTGVPVRMVCVGPEREQVVTAK